MAPPDLADFGLAAGELVDGKYRIDRLLGSGGAGMVVAALHLGLDEPRALKLLRPEVFGDPLVEARFEREARAVVKIKGEHVCAVHDVGRCARFGPYLVMDLLVGRDLGALLAERGPLPVAEAARYALEALEALAQAHAMGIVHRDLKPGNLFAAEDAEGNRVLKVLDYGISKLLDEAARPGEPQLTKPSMLMGSLPYVSPEQAKDPTDVDPRADLWGVGAVLYELLTGARAFPGPTPSAVLLQVMTAEPLPLRELRPEVPAGLEAVVVRCLAKERRARFASAGELALALGAFVPGSAALVGRITRLSPPAALAADARATIELASTPDAPPSGTLLLEESASTAPSAQPPSVGSAPTMFQPPTASSPGRAAPPSSPVGEAAAPTAGASPLGFPAAPRPTPTGPLAPRAPLSARAQPARGLGVAAALLGSLLLIGAGAFWALRATSANEESVGDAASISERAVAPVSSVATATASTPATTGEAGVAAPPDAGVPSAPLPSAPLGEVTGDATVPGPRVAPGAPPTGPAGGSKNPLTEW